MLYRDRENAEVRDGPRLSLAIPLYNEEQIVPELLRRVRAVLTKIPGGPHELVFVNDGSSDGTLALLAAAADDDPRIVIISLSRNFGHQAAVSAALDHVSGDLVVIMDGDLQDSPEVIPDLIRKQKEGFDIVYVQRTGRKESWFLRSCYFLFYRLLGMFSNIKLPVDAGDFALLSRRVIEELRRLPEHHRYLRGLRSWVGFRQTGIYAERSGRFAGKSKYSFIKLLALAFDGLFAFSIVPLRVATLLGLFTICLALLYVAYAIYVKTFLGQSPQGFTTLVVVMTFFSGVQLLFLGVLGEYLGRIYEETKGRPHYIIDSIVGRRPWTRATDVTNETAPRITESRLQDTA